MTSKIVSRVFGGLGNQIFCYAAARRLAWANNAELVIDDVSGFRFDEKYNRQYQLDCFHIPCRKATAEERLEPFSKVRRNLKRRFNQYLPYEKRSYLTQDRVDYDSRLLKIRPRGTVYLEGYWQSEEYFKDIESIVRQDLKFKSPSDNANVEMQNRIKNCTAVAVHVRYFDDPHETGINNISTAYYNSAIERMEKLVSDAYYFLFTDKPESARAQIKMPDERVVLVKHNQGDSAAFADLWLMSSCDHFIIANSTFSWWGAWLSAEPNKYVFAPGIEMRHGKMFWGFDGLIPEQWIKI